MRTRNLFSLYAVGTALVMLTTSPRASAQESLKCRAADQTSAGLITQLTNWVTTTDPERIADRDTLFHVPVVPVSQITLVTDEKICVKVIATYAALPGGYTPPTVYVVKMGSKNYVGYDPTYKAGEYSIVFVF